MRDPGRPTGSIGPMLSSFALLAAAESESHGIELPIPPIGFGAIALILFAAGLVALWSFRNTAGGVEESLAERQEGATKMTETGAYKDLDDRGER